MASALTPAGTLSSSKTTLCGNALLLTNSTVSPLATVMDGGCARRAVKRHRVSRSVHHTHKKINPAMHMQSDRVYANSLTWTESTHTRVGSGRVDGSRFKKWEEQISTG